MRAPGGGCWCTTLRRHSVARALALSLYLRLPLYFLAFATYFGPVLLMLLWMVVLRVTAKPWGNFALWIPYYRRLCQISGIVAYQHDPYLYVSDGGHYDNLGLYQVLPCPCDAASCPWFLHGRGYRGACGGGLVSGLFGMVTRVAVGAIRMCPLVCVTDIGDVALQCVCVGVCVCVRACLSVRFVSQLSPLELLSLFFVHRCLPTSPSVFHWFPFVRHY